MKIVILSDGIPPEGKGGAERIAWQSAQMLHAAGNEVIVITTTRVPLAQTIESTIEGIRVFSISSNYHARWRAWVSLYNPRPVREVKSLLKELKPDIVHAHNVHHYLSYASLGVARASGARVFHTIHDAMSFNYDKLSDFVNVKNPVCVTHTNYRISAWNQFREQRLRYNPFRNLSIRRSLKNVDVLISVSHALADALAQNGITNAHVLYNGVDASEWKVSLEAITSFSTRHELSGKKVILFGGRITGTKGGDALLAALPGIIAAEPETILLIIGTENDYVRSLISRAAENGIASHIRITGWIGGDDLRAAYHVADIVAVPSVYLDPLPTVVLEAMACAKPVVGSCLGGIPEMVDNGVTGYVLHPLDTAHLTDSCVGLLQDANLARSFGANGAKRQAALFSAELHLRLLLQSYDGSSKSI